MSVLSLRFVLDDPGGVGAAGVDAAAADAGMNE